MSEDPFLCPECGHHEMSVVGSSFRLEPLFQLECDECGRRWNTRAPWDAFYRD